MAFRQHLVAGVEIALLEALKENTDYEGLLGTDLTPGAPRFCPFSTHPSPSPTKSSGLPFRGIDGAHRPLMVQAPTWAPVCIQSCHVSEGTGPDLSGLSLLPAPRLQGKAQERMLVSDLQASLRKEAWLAVRLPSELSTAACQALGA